MTARARYAQLTSLLEVPLLKEAYWAKIPGVRAAGIMLDLEDSAHPDVKVAGRDWLIQALRDRSIFGGREVIVRVNNLDTPWGRDDLAALARQPEPLIVCYPKVRSADEIAEVVRLSREHVPERGVLAMVETAAAVLDLDVIAKTPGVIGFHFGYTDYAVDSGARLYAPEGDDLHPALWGVRHHIAMVAAARGLFATGGTMIPQFRDVAKVRRFVASWADAGYTGMLALSPAHLDVVADVFIPHGEERARHEVIIAGFEDAQAAGRTSLVLDGAIVTESTYLQSVAAMRRILD